MKILFEKINRKYRKYPVPYRFYIASLIVYIFGFALYFYAGESTLTVATTVASALIICGFLTWCFPIARWLHSVWDRPFGKTPIVIFHLFALLASTVCARFAVSESLGLPPQSFDLTVGFLALLFYIPALLGVMAVVLLLSALVFVPVAGMGLIFKTVRQHIVSFLLIFGFKPENRSGYDMVFFNIAGALLSSALLAWSFTYLTNNFSSGFKAMTKVIAVRSDFHKAPNYPGSGTDEYVHPLENGFIAYAREEQDKHIIIGIRLQSTAPQDVQIESISSIKKIISGVVEGSVADK